MTAATLLLHPPHAANPAAWEWVHAAGSVHQHATLVTAVVPASALSWHRVVLPAGTIGRAGRPARAGAASSPRLRAVLEGLLEDQLLDEPAQLHFALQPAPPATGPVWVAVCQRSWLRHALNALQQAGHDVVAVVPEWAPALDAETPATVWMTGSPEDAELVWTDIHGVHRRPLPSHGMPAALPPDWGPHTELLAEPAVAAWAETVLHRDAEVQDRAQRLHACAASPWNLAQLEFARRSPWATRVAQTASALWQAPQWRPARGAALLLLLAQVLGLNAWAWHAQSQLALRRTALHDTLLSTFPQTTVVVNAPLQMERAVGTLRQASGQASPRDLESLLGALGGLEGFETLAPINNAQAAINFVAGELHWSGWSLTPAQASAWQQQLQTQGYALTLDGDTLRLSPQANPARGTP